MMMEAVHTSETSVDNLFARHYNPEDSSEHHTRRRENLKSHTILTSSPMKTEECYNVNGGTAGPNNQTKIIVKVAS
jgi:hypothetical protein